MTRRLWRPLRVVWAGGRGEGIGEGMKGTEGVPRRIVLPGPPRKVYHVVRVLETWREVGEWWRGEEELQAFRVLTEDGSLLEVVFLRKSRRWMLTRVYD